MLFRSTVMHELFHMSRRFDGTLHARRRHAVLGEEFYRQLKPLVRRYLKVCSPELLAALARSGEVRVLQWLERPGPAYVPEKFHGRTVYTEEQLYYGLVRLMTRKGARAPLAGPRAVRRKARPEKVRRAQ